VSSATPSRQPLLDACRQIKSILGETTERAGVFREGRDIPDITCPVNVGAATTVSERDKGTVTFGKYQAYPPPLARQVAHDGLRYGLPRRQLKV
jgi:hypothetical protein